MAQLGELQALLNPQERQTVQILAVSIDSHEDSRKLRQKLEAGGGRGQSFPMLQDTGSTVIKRYGILNPQSRGWPHPATYVIDKQGVVRWKAVETDYRISPTNEQILEQIGKLR